MAAGPLPATGDSDANAEQALADGADAGGLDLTPLRGEPRGGVSVVLVLAWDPKKIVGPSVGLQAQTSPWLAGGTQPDNASSRSRTAYAGAHSSTLLAPRLDPGRWNGNRRSSRGSRGHATLGYRPPSQVEQPLSHSTQFVAA